jgi:hypothetical protein
MIISEKERKMYTTTLIILSILTYCIYAEDLQLCLPRSGVATFQYGEAGFIDVCNRNFGQLVMNQQRDFFDRARITFQNRFCSTDFPQRGVCLTEAEINAIVNQATLSHQG